MFQSPNRWSKETFLDYIKDPRAKIPGTKMIFPGIKNETEANNLWAYLASFDASGKKTEDALFVSVKQNGKTIHENVRAPKPTGSEIDSKEAAKGPIMLQGDHGPVAYRNITVKPLAMREGK